MDISADFAGLWRQVDRVGGKLIEFDWAASEQLAPIDVELAQGKQVKLEDLEVINGLLGVHGRQVLLYIPDQFHPVEIVQREAAKGHRFHVADCETLESMRSQKRFDRYIVTNDLTGVFHISGKSVRGGSTAVDTKLLICRNCLRKLNYKNYLYGRKSEVWKKFDIPEFFETYSTSFRYLPRKLPGRGVGNDYTQDWSQISARVRTECNFRCDACGVDLSGDRQLLHVHHVNGVRTDNDRVNLRPLCADCHRKQPLHAHMFLSARDMQRLEMLRRQQGITANTWDQVFALADQSVHGALHYAREHGFEPPDVGCDLANDRNAVASTAEAAWLSKRLAIYVADRPAVKGWNLVTPDEFLSRY